MIVDRSNINAPAVASPACSSQLFDNRMYGQPSPFARQQNQHRNDTDLSSLIRDLQQIADRSSEELFNNSTMNTNHKPNQGLGTDLNYFDSRYASKSQPVSPIIPRKQVPIQPQLLTRSMSNSGQPQLSYQQPQLNSQNFRSSTNTMNVQQMNENCYHRMAPPSQVQFSAEPSPNRHVSTISNAMNRTVPHILLNEPPKSLNHGVQQRLPSDYWSNIMLQPSNQNSYSPGLLTPSGRRSADVFGGEHKHHTSRQDGRHSADLFGYTPFNDNSFQSNQNSKPLFNRQAITPPPNRMQNSFNDFYKESLPYGQQKQNQLNREFSTRSPTEHLVVVNRRPSNESLGPQSDRLELNNSNHGLDKTFPSERIRANSACQLVNSGWF